MSDGNVPLDLSPPEADSCIVIAGRPINVPTIDMIEPDAIAKQRMYDLQVRSNRIERFRLCALIANTVGVLSGVSMAMLAFYINSGWAWFVGPVVAVVGGIVIGFWCHDKCDDWLCLKPAHDHIYGPRS